MDYYSAIKKNEIMPLAATWMDLEIIILSEVSQKEKDKYHITYMWNLKYDINELISKAESDSHLWLPRGWDGGGVDWEFGVSRCKQLHIE